MTKLTVVLPVVLSVLTYLGGFSAIAEPLEQAAKSQERPQEPSSGPRLTFREKSRSPSPSGDMIIYVLRADGLPQDKSYSLTRTLMNGKTAAVPQTLHIDGSGRVLTKDEGELDLVLGGMFAGEFVVLTLVSEDGASKASVEITPFPIEAVGKGGCRLSVKPLSVKGEMFSISGEGFKPGEEIKGVERSSGEVMDAHLNNKGGNLKVVVFPAVVGRTGGEASLTASDSSCSVTVNYKWGDAMAGKPQTGSRAAPEAQATPAPPALPTPSQTDAQPAASPTPKPSKGGRQVYLALAAVTLDQQIAVINAFLPHVKGALYLGKEKITHENMKDTVERLQRERGVLAEEIDREGFDNVAGNYDWPGGQSADCKLKEPPSDASGAVTVVQHQHAVEFKGSGPARCGIVVGTVVVLQAGKCGDASVSTMKFVGIARPDESIKMQLYDTGSNIRCDAGALTKR